MLLIAKSRPHWRVGIQGIFTVTVVVRISDKNCADVTRAVCGPYSRWEAFSTTSGCTRDVLSVLKSLGTCSTAQPLLSEWRQRQVSSKFLLCSAYETVLPSYASRIDQRALERQGNLVWYMWLFQVLYSLWHNASVTSYHHPIYCVRRQSLPCAVHRDFGPEQGYFCPSSVRLVFWLNGIYHWSQNSCTAAH